jgi:deoxyribodipyrimidine photo-lyase
MNPRPIVVWIRRDLRIDDHTALYQAAQTGRPLIPLFVFDRQLIERLPSDGAAFEYQAEALREVAGAIAELGGRLIIRQGGVEEVHRRVLEETRPAALYHNRDYEPAARKRDGQIAMLYRSYGAEVVTFKDLVLQEPGEVLTPDGRPYVVFTPYANSWKRKPEPAPLGKPRGFSTPDLPSDPILGAAGLKRKCSIARPAFAGGEKAARHAWKTFLKGPVTRYATGRDLPGLQGTSRMSAALRFGCISVRRMLDDLRTKQKSLPAPEARSVAKYVDELIWREFYQAVLYHYPRLLESNYRAEFDRLPWKFDEQLFQSWREGRTGYPLVDAGMRELNETGWMHNRVRMVVASFLTKDLLHDWKLGEAVFEEKLMDIERASNNGGWQWSASTGVDPRPLRIFNPRLQSARYDPEGEYIRRYVPELASVPAKFVHAPQTMPAALQRELGVVIGKHYPTPVVDHAEASAAYKQVFAQIKRRD